ncbi:hypothetical protein CAPTEDRAFT_147329 [Capitella teleta]|uniref:Fucosyltransferase n=1 Tax=Capitella teleta TaxID=283909 RepID=R7VJ88_CAPTE|nr:hypothetical protein CAPTEDRAFT_147329 [Capitella teleta]|eukprot:ELU18689.1 hypothetical protein CAPTEDRAFT_147329 [Capitella teleta]
MKCIFTSDRNSLSTSDAIVFRGRRLPKFEFPPRMTHQKWIFYETEPPHKTWMFANLTKYNGLFNMTSTYAADSHIPFTRMKSCHKDWHIYNELSGEDFGAKKRKDVPVAWFASRCLTQSRREDYVKELQEHIKVDIYGKCGDKQCGSNIREDDCDKSLLHVEGSYKFYLSFENSICDDYVSEKLWKVLNLNVVPVVMGGVEYSNMMPKDSFIDVRDFNSAKDLAKYISYLDSNNTAYNAILRNKASLQCEALNPKRGKGCNICHRLHETKGQVSVVHALDAFWGSRRCLSPEVYHQTQAVDDFEVDLEEVKKVSLAGNK